MNQDAPNIYWTDYPAPVRLVGNVVEFFADGEPRPKGSWKAIMPKYGKFPIVKCDNDHTKPWQAHVSTRAGDAMGDRQLIDGAVALSVEFVFHRPASVSRRERYHRQTASCNHGCPPGSRLHRGQQSCRCPMSKTL
jgi:hypothetical protein